MFNAYSSLIGRRYSGNRSGSQLVSFISRLSMAGMVLGIAVLIVVLSLMNGFETELRQRILGLVPQVSVYQRDGIEDWQGLSETLRQTPEVIASAPFVELQGLAYRKGKTLPVVLYGVVPDLEMEVSVIKEFVDPQALHNLTAATGKNTVIIGSVIAEKLKLAIGDSFRLVLPGVRPGQAAKIKVLKTAEIIHTGTELDQHLLLTGLETAAQLSATPNSVSGIRLALSDVDFAPQVRNFLSQDLGYGFYISDWTHTKGNLYHGIKTSKKLVGLILLLIIAIAAFNVVSTLVMVVIEKQGSIAILRTMGASTQGIMGIFVMQGAIIGLIGAVLGASLGCALAIGLPDIVVAAELLFGFQFLHSDVYPISYVPSDLRWQDVVKIAGVAMAMSVLASLYPAWRAANVGPAQVLRHE